MASLQYTELCSFLILPTIILINITISVNARSVLSGKLHHQMEQKPFAMSNNNMPQMGDVKGEEDVWTGASNIGSKPPTCQNKCSSCTPCKPVQVPTSPSHGMNPTTSHHSLVFVSPNDSNYKPLGWKCKCGNRLFNP